MEDLKFVMLIVYTAVVCITGSHSYTIKNETYEVAEPIYMCACDPPCHGSTVCTTPGKCYAHKNKLSGLLVRSCFTTMEQSGLNCHSKITNHIIMCCEGHMCNLNLIVEQPDADKDSLLLVVIVTACVVVTVVVLTLATVYLIHRHVCQRTADSLLLTPELKLLDDDSVYRSFHDGSRQDQWSSGSGSGQPTLVPRTVGKQVTLIERIGKGRFGEVWRGKLLDDDVAVKTFSSLDEVSWKQETDIYNTGMLHHENILGYYASDTVGILSCTQNWLILQYHRNGSLYDYLQSSDIDMEEMLLLAHSAAAGLTHLHTEIKEGTGKHEKPEIAHRDIKSKNILVKDNGQCCIGDLGHAISSLKRETEPEKLLVGTKRYMAPEVLAETLKPEFFEAFKCVDVYAFGLVLWEIAKRAQPYAEEYRIPFWDLVPADPSFEDMKKVVVLEQQRPPIPNRWSQDPVMCHMSGLMSGCWTQNPKNRVTILRVKKNLYSLLEYISGSHAEKMEKLSPRFVDGSSRSSSGNSSCHFSGHL
uniref:receptor protein serine/threonine kinase n=1 Tax=Arion vulgaris TaxID=1028688 RepID=A0A0B6Z503_9EUPU